MIAILYDEMFKLKKIKDNILVFESIKSKRKNRDNLLIVSTLR